MEFECTNFLVNVGVAFAVPPRGRPGDRWIGLGAMRRGTGPDHALVQQLRAGDEQAFTEVVEAYDGQLRRLARHFVRTDALAADVVQETWLAVFDGIDRFEERASLKTWIFRILVNRARTRAVREARQVPMSSLSREDSGPSIDPSAFGSDGTWRSSPPMLDAEPEGSLLAKELRERLGDIIDTLPEPGRTVILMRDFAGLDGRAVADALGITDGNQRVLLHRARTRVRLALNEYVKP